MPSIARHAARILSVPFALALPLVAMQAAPAVAATPPVPRFLSAAEAKSVLTEGEEARYFDLMQLAELRAKTGLPLQGMTPVQAREAARRHYATETADFTPAERSALQGVLQRLAPAFEERAPAYLKAPWCFLKVSMRVEGGLPHTRGDCIVLSPMVLGTIAALGPDGRGTGGKEASPRDEGMARYLLAHEETHVLQRRNPALFATLYTGVLGYRHVAPVPMDDWMRAHQVVNPDAPDIGWALAVQEEGRPRWILSFLALTQTEAPSMPRDFENLGIALADSDAGWKLDGAPEGQLETARRRFEAFTRLLPNRHQAYHPNEVGADWLGTYLAAPAGALPDHPARDAMIAWVKANLR